MLQLERDPFRLAEFLTGLLERLLAHLGGRFDGSTESFGILGLAVVEGLAEVGARCPSLRLGTVL